MCSVLPKAIQLTEPFRSRRGKSIDLSRLYTVFKEKFSLEYHEMIFRHSGGKKKHNTLRNVVRRPSKTISNIPSLNTNTLTS